MRTPTNEPTDTPLSSHDQAALELRRAAISAAAAHVGEDLALAEVRFAYSLHIRRETPR